MMAFRTDIVGRKGIDFRDAGHRRDKGRADGATRTDHVAAIVGPSHELGRDPVDDGISVVDDTFQLRFKPFANLRRKRIPVSLFRRLEHQVREHLVRPGDVRRIELVLCRPDRGVDHLVYLPRVVDDDFLGKLVVSQEAEAFDHFVRRPEMLVGIGYRVLIPLFLHLLPGRIVGSEIEGMPGAMKSLGCDENVPVNLVGRFDIMAIAGGDDHLPDVLCGLDQILDDLFDLLHGPEGSLVDEIDIIGRGLDLDIVIEGQCPLENVFPLVHGMLEHLAIEAGGAKEKVCPHFGQIRFWNEREAEGGHVMDMRLRDDFIQILQTGRILDQHGCMIWMHGNYHFICDR